MPMREIPEHIPINGCLKKRPHSILFGMMVTGIIIGADTGVIYIRGEYPESVKSSILQLKNLKNKNVLKE